jgi:hypothetical protein
MTPEGYIKKKIKYVLAIYTTVVYYYMPVPGGYGKATVDFLGCANGHFFAIEAKRPGKGPTMRQQGVLDDVELAGGRTFAINDDAGVEELDAWLREVCRV